VIDLHSHILPGVDDGAPDIETSLEMARCAVNDGIDVMACTPHFMPGLYDNESNDIRRRVLELNEILIANDIELALVVGSDAHIRPDFVKALREGKILTLHDTRYVLFEPPHMMAPKHMDELLFNVRMAGYVPILTHPERYKWIENSYSLFKELVQNGVWMQITAGSLTGRFGKRSKYWAQKMLGEGLVHIIATDAHNLKSRPPLLAEAREIAQREVGRDEALHLVLTRPEMVLEDLAPEDVPAPAIERSGTAEGKTSFFRRIFGV
jgi:protein-tyrosine phosphatase